MTKVTPVLTFEATEPRTFTNWELERLPTGTILVHSRYGIIIAMPLQSYGLRPFHCRIPAKNHVGDVSHILHGEINSPSGYTMSIVGQETLAEPTAPVSERFNHRTPAHAVGDASLRELFHRGVRLGVWIDKTEARKDKPAPQDPAEYVVMVDYGYGSFKGHPDTERINFQAFFRRRTGWKRQQDSLNWVTLWSEIDLLEFGP